jgi:hypothetical protein
MSDSDGASAFSFPGGAAAPIHVKVATSTATIIAGNANYAVQVAWFQVTEIAGGTATLTIDIFDGTTAYLLRNALAMTAKAEYLYGRGFWLNPGEFLRVTTSSANQVDVIGLTTIPKP